MEPGMKQWLGEPAIPDQRKIVKRLANRGLARRLNFGIWCCCAPTSSMAAPGRPPVRRWRIWMRSAACLRRTFTDRTSTSPAVERLKHRPDGGTSPEALVQTFLDHSLCIAEDTPHGRHLVSPW